MENYDLFSDDLGRGILDGLPGVGNTGNAFAAPGAGSLQHSTADIMQNYNNQTPQYTQIGQGMGPPSKMTPNYPDYTSQYGQYGSGSGTSSQPSSMGGYGAAPPGGAPARPMAGGYPSYQGAPSIHYQDYSQSQSMMRSSGSVQQPLAPAPRMAAPTQPAAGQQQFAGYRPPSQQEAMYVQQMQRWGEQHSSYGSTLPHYPANAGSAYRQPHAYNSNLPRPPQPQTAAQPPTGPQQSTSTPPQHNIPSYMTRPQGSSSSALTQQSQYGQSMYGTSTSQYSDYHHGVNRMPTPSPVSQSSYSVSSPHAPQQTQQSQYGISSAQYGNQFGQYYAGQGGSSSQQLGSQSGPSPSVSGPMGGSYPNSSYSSGLPVSSAPVHNGSSGTSYRPPAPPSNTNYAQMPQLSPRLTSPRPPAPSPRPTTPASPAQVASGPTTPHMTGIPPTQQNAQPSSLQQLEQMVMPHVNKNSPSPKPQMGGMMGSNTGVLSPMSRTPMSPVMSGPKGPMSPTSWPPPNRMSQQQQQPPQLPVASKPSYVQNNSSNNNSNAQGFHHIPSNATSMGNIASPMSTGSNSGMENNSFSNIMTNRSQDDMGMGNAGPGNTTSSMMDSLGGNSNSNTSSSSIINSGSASNECPLPPSSMGGVNSTMNSSGPVNSGGNKEELKSPMSSSELNTNSGENKELARSIDNNGVNQTICHSPMPPHLAPNVDNSHQQQMERKEESSNHVSDIINSCSTGGNVNNISNNSLSVGSMLGNGNEGSSNKMDMSSSSDDIGLNSSRSEGPVVSSNNSVCNSGPMPYGSNSSNSGVTTPSSTSGYSSSPHHQMSVPTPPPQSGMMGQQAPMGGPGSASSSMMMGGYGQQNVPQQMYTGNSSMGSSSRPPNQMGAYPPQRFPGPGPDMQTAAGQQQIRPGPQGYMNSYGNGVGGGIRPDMYPPPPTGGHQYGPMRPPGPAPYQARGMGPPMPSSGGPHDRLHFELMQTQQQLQHLYSMPPSSQTQMQVCLAVSF